MSRRSRSVPSLQTPSTPTEYKSSRVSACSTLMCPCDNCGAGEGMCAHSGDACCTQLLGNSGGIIRSPGEASSDAVYSSFGSLLPPHPDSQLCSPVLGMKSGDSFLYTITLLELLPILSFISVGFGPEGGPGCQGGQADRQPLCLDPAAALESWNKSLPCLRAAGEITRMLLPLMAWIRNIQGGKEKGRYLFNRNKSNKMMGKSMNTGINQPLSKEIIYLL